MIIRKTVTLTLILTCNVLLFAQVPQNHIYSSIAGVNSEPVLYSDVSLNTFEMLTGSIQFSKDNNLQKAVFAPFKFFINQKKLLPKNTSAVAKWRAAFLDALTQTRVNLPQKEGLTTFGIGLGYDWTSPFSLRGNQVFSNLSVPISLQPGPAGETTDQYSLRREAHFRQHIVPIYKQYYEDLQTGFKLNAGWNRSFFEVIGGDTVDRDNDGVIDNFHRNRGYDITIGGTFTFAGAFAMNLNWHKGQNYSSAKKNEKQVPYNGGSGSVALRIAVLNSKYETTEDYLKSLFIPSLIVGFSYEYQKVIGNEIFAKDGITKSRVITPFMDFKINPKTQFRIGVPIKRYSGVTNETSFGPFIQYTLQLANRE